MNIPSKVARHAFLFVLSFLLTTVAYTQSKEPGTAIRLNSADLLKLLKARSLQPAYKNNMPNAMAVTPQLAQLLPKNLPGFNAYKLNGGMTCITPDSLTNLKLLIDRRTLGK